jgi:dihydroorotase
MVNLNLPDSTSTATPAYKCGWSPFEGMAFSSSIINTMVNGILVVENGKLTGSRNAQELKFNR